MKKILALTFLAVATPALAADVSYGALTSHGWKGLKFDADKLTYDVDTRTGKCYATAATLYVAGGSPVGVFSMAAVPCDKEVLALVSAEKRNAYVRKFDEPKN